MREKKQAMRMVLSVITFTVLLIYLVNHTNVIVYFVKRFISLILPFLIGCGIAFIVNIIMTSIEDTLFKDTKGRFYKNKRVISMILSYIIAVCILLVVLFIVIPEVVDTFGKIRDKLPVFVENAKEVILKYTKKFPDITESIKNFDMNSIDWEGLGLFVADEGSTILSKTVSIFSSIASAVMNIAIGLVFSMYILSQKEMLGRQVKLVCYAIFKESTADEIMVFGKIANTTFSKFFACQFREGIILGAMFIIAMSVLGMPYPLTVGVLLAFTALIPVFGAFVGCFIGAFLILVESPKFVIGFIILFFVLQFIENYFIYPKLVGGDIGLGAIWVLLAVLVGGDLMGIVGMFVFIPLVSVLYAYFRSLIYRKLKKKKIDVDKKQVPDDVIPLMESRRRVFQPKEKKQGDDILDSEDTLDELTDDIENK